jgi:hypothetical protein
MPNATQTPFSKLCNIPFKTKQKKKTKKQMLNEEIEKITTIGGLSHTQKT